MFYISSSYRMFPIFPFYKYSYFYSYELIFISFCLMYDMYRYFCFVKMSSYVTTIWVIMGNKKSIYLAFDVWYWIQFLLLVFRNFRNRKSMLSYLNFVRFSRSLSLKIWICNASPKYALLSKLPILDLTKSRVFIWSYPIEKSMVISLIKSLFFERKLWNCPRSLAYKFLIAFLLCICCLAIESSIQFRTPKLIFLVFSTFSNCS